MKKNNYFINSLIIIFSLGTLSSSLTAQIRTSSADYSILSKFNTSQNSKNGLIYEVLPGPSVINPLLNPTPFSDNISMSAGSYSLSVSDVDDIDSPNSLDNVTDVNILFTGNNGQKYKIDKINIIHKPEGAGDHTFFGGIGLNKIMHGNSGIGTGLMPKMMAYITLWGLVDLKDANMDTVIASRRIIHLMVATNVRDNNLKMDTTVVGDGSDYNIQNAQTHVILPPLDMAGNKSPIPGTDHGFLHMMFEKPILSSGNEDWKKVYEVLPGPAAINPMMNPTPFSNRISIGAGSYEIGVIDRDSLDSRNSKDSVLNVNIRFERPNGDKFLIDKINIIHKPEGAGDHPFFGGIGFDELMHGNTGIGIGLMPKMTSYITLWGIVDLKDGQGNVIAAKRIIHLMVASRVRRNDLTMITSVDIDSSDYNSDNIETHIILPPQDMQGNRSPVPGTGHGFLHLMFENVSLMDSIITSTKEQSNLSFDVINYPNPFADFTTIEYNLKHKSFVNLNIYNIKGNLISSLVNEEQSAGVYQKKFYGNKSLVQGTYIYVLEIDGVRNIGKINYVK